MSGPDEPCQFCCYMQQQLDGALARVVELEERAERERHNGAVMAECNDLEKARAERYRAALEGVLPMAEALHRLHYGIPCDHDEDCHCDAEARSSEALRAARAALAWESEG